MRILQVCHRFPYPPNDGGTMAMNSLTNGLMENGNEVKVISLNTKKHFVDLKTLPQEYLDKTNAEAVFIDTSIYPVSAFLNLFSSDSYHISRFISNDFKIKLKNILQHDSYDIVQFESLFVTPYISVVKKYSSAKIVLRAHNVEHLIWEKLVANSKNPIKKNYLQLLTRRLKRFEKEIIHQTNAILSITPEDAVFFRHMGYKNKITLVPFGVDVDKQKETSFLKKNEPILYHLGSMDWIPNQEGLKWFFENVWKTISIENDTLRCYIAGRNMPTDFFKLKSDRLFVDGEIKDSQFYLADKTILIVPLFSGSGMRVKIIEAMAAGKTVISTSLGAQGIKYENEKNILIADDAETFLKHLRRCISDIEFCNSIGKQAQLLAEQEYSNKNICASLHNFYLNLINH